MNQTKKIIKIKSKKTTPKTYAYECEVCEGTQFTHPKFYCPQCEQEMCPCCSGEIMKCREGIFEGQTVCLTCYNNPEFEEGEEPEEEEEEETTPPLYKREWSREDEPAAVCPPVNKKAQRTFVNLGIDPKTADRFKPDDTCERCGHFFKRGMIKEYHYASKNCQKQKPYSETEKGQAGKGGEHTARKARKAADPTRELTKEINAYRKTNQLRGFFTYKDDAEKREAWDTLYQNLVDIPKFLGWIINNIDDAKRITSMRWDADTIELLGKITDINITVEKAKTTGSLGGVELGSMGGGTQQVSVRDYMDGNY